MGIFRLSLPALLTATLLASCANMGLTQTGFLDHYEGLEPAPERRVFWVPDDILLERTSALEARLDSGGFDAVVIDPVVYLPVEGARYTMSEGAAEKVCSYATRKLRTRLEGHFEVLDTPRPGAARVRMAITDVNPSNVLLNVVGLIVAVPPDYGGVSGEIEIVDAISGQRFAAMTATREGTVLLGIECFSKHGHARHGAKKWAVEVSRIMRGK